MRQSITSVRVITPLTVLLLIALLLTPAANTADKATELDTYVNAACDVLGFQGAVLVARDGVPIFAKGYGMANIDQKIPNTPETEFLIGSITKQFTAAAILQLQEQGKLNVQDSISKYLPDYPQETGDRITIHHLLTHTSGIPSYTDMSDVMARRNVDMSHSDLIATFKDQPLQFEPGSAWRYCNSGYYLLGLIIEAASGQTYQEYLHEHIFQPLGMTHTGYPENEPTGQALGYMAPDGELVPADKISMTLPYAAGALSSTVGDLLIWDQALYGDKVLTEESKELMYTPVRDNYAYGWFVDDRLGHRHIGHGGGIDGFSSMISRFPDDNVTIIVLSNNASASGPSLAGSLTAVVFDQPYDLPVIKTPIAADPATFDAYVGPYQISDGQYRIVRRDGDNLYSQRSGGPVFQLFPEAEDKFFFEHDNASTLTFVRDETGRIIAHVIRAQGTEQRADLVTGPLADSLMAQRQAADVDPAIFERYVGEYELMPGFILTFRARDNRLFSQATGQEEFEVFPSSETEFFLRVVDAQITFVVDENGEVTGLMLHQGGRDMPAKKIK